MQNRPRPATLRSTFFDQKQRFQVAGIVIRNKMDRGLGFQVVLRWWGAWFRVWGFGLLLVTGGDQGAPGFRGKGL